MEEKITKRKRIRKRKQNPIYKYFKAQANPQGYKATFIDDPNNTMKKTYQTPDGQAEKLTELIDDNSHAPVTAGPKKNITMNTIPSKFSGKPDDMDFTLDIFDSDPAPSSQIKSNITEKPANQPVVYNSPAAKIKNVLPERPNLTVINRNEGNIVPTKPKLVVAQSSKINQGANTKTIPQTKPVDPPAQIQNTGKSTVETQKPAESTVQTQRPEPTSTQTKPTGFKGRMTAASFLTHSVLPMQQSIPGFSTPKGIPRSFLATRPETVPNVPVQLMPYKQKPPNMYVVQSRKKGQVRHLYKYEDQGEIPAPIDQSSAPSLYKDPDFGKKAPALSQGGQSISQSGQSMRQSGQSISQSGQEQKSQGDLFGQVYVNVDNNQEQCQQYSPSDVYADGCIELEDDAEQSPENRSKRLSAFQRLGPPAQAKKPKLTINLLVNKDQSVREVVDSSSEEDKYSPVHLREDIQMSTDDTVMKYLLHWPYNKNLSYRRQVNSRHTKSSFMSLEIKQMEEAYDRDNAFFQITVTGYPPSWCKEDVLDAILESVQEKSFIPCFIEFLKNECKFFVIRSKPALLDIHNNGFTIHKRDVELQITISQLRISTNQIEFIPRLVLRKRLMMAIENELDLNLSEFTIKSDISHFIYFPLNRVANQSELVNMQSSVPWLHLTKLNLSRNKITTLSGFNLESLTPRLKHLDISHNYINDIKDLIKCRQLPLNSIVLEGNPVCLDYMQEMYVKVLRMMFSELREIDGVKLTLPGEFPKYIRNYCPEDARLVTEKVLEVMFPLLDAHPEDRLLIENMYDVNALMTITFMYKLRYGTIYKEHRSLFNRARWLEEGDTESIQGAPAIAKLMYRWPVLCHDPTTFTVDVLYHTLTTTIIRISGVMKVTAESLAENEHLLLFTRTLVLNSIDCVEYKITNELVHWDLPDKEITKIAFRQTTGRSNDLNLKLESPPDEDLKENFVEIFMKLTELDRKASKRCLEMKEWHFKNALEYFYKLLKLDNIEPLLN